MPAFGIRDGELLLKASYAVASKQRVTITLDKATLVRHAPQELRFSECLPIAAL